MESFSSATDLANGVGKGYHKEFTDKNQKKINSKREKYAGHLNDFDVRSKSKITNGMVTSRRPTNCLCLILFLGTIAGMIFLTVYSYKNGNFKALVSPVDGDLQICGTVKGFEEYDKLYITDLSQFNIKDLFETGVCVKNCP